MTDIRKFALVHLRLLTDLLEDLREGEELELQDNLFNVLFYELMDSNEICVKLEISQIFVNLSHISDQFTEKLADLDFLHKIIQMTYCNCIQLIENLVIIIGNIFFDADLETSNYFTTHVPVVYRLKEMLQNFNFEINSNLLNSILYCLNTVIIKTSVERFIIVH